MTDICTVLFDLDGTFADTAPDLAHALNEVLQEEGRDPLPFEAIRPVVSHGGVALIRFGFGMEPDHPEFPRLRQRLLDIYEANLVGHTQLFPGMAELLATIESRGMTWGIVTNKPAWLTDPLMGALGLAERAACIVSGDTTQNKKPHPEPMHHACSLAGCQAGTCVYVGDAERDIQAGRAAGMRTIVALFGYIGAGDEPDAWGADAMVNHPMEIMDHVDAWNAKANAG